MLRSLMKLGTQKFLSKGTYTKTLTCSKNQKFLAKIQHLSPLSPYLGPYASSSKFGEDRTNNNL